MLILGKYILLWQSQQTFWQNMNQKTEKNTYLTTNNC